MVSMLISAIGIKRSVKDKRITTVMLPKCNFCTGLNEVKDANSKPYAKFRPGGDNNCYLRFDNDLPDSEEMKELIVERY